MGLRHVTNCAGVAHTLPSVLTAFSVLTLLVGWQEGLLACKKLMWCDSGMVICLGRSADLHMAQLMPLPLTISCSSVSRLVLPSCKTNLPAFNALMQLIGRQEGHPACKQLSGGVLAWLSVWGEVQISCIWPSQCHCRSLSLASVKSRLVLVPALPVIPAKSRGP